MNMPLRTKKYSNLLALVPQLPGLGRLCWRLWRDHRVPRYLKGMVVAALLYALSPVDLLPGFLLPVVGQLDDVTLVMLAGYFFIRWSPQEGVQEHLALLRRYPSTWTGGRQSPASSWNGRS